MATANPPLRKHTTRRIPRSAALNLISSYLLASKTNPSLHPDALLTESGPLASYTDGLTLHNLRRIEAGLRGDNLGADLTFSKFGGQGLPNLQARAPGPISGTGRRGGANGEKGTAGEEGWQDREEFEREQEVVVGGGGRGEEMMKRGKGSGVRVRVLEGEDDDRPIGGDGGGGDVVSVENKEDRKKRKRERKQNEKREKEMRKQRKREAG